MISSHESPGSPETESTTVTHDASRKPLPASTRVYVPGQLHPKIRVPMREIGAKSAIGS